MATQIDLVWIIPCPPPQFLLLWIKYDCFMRFCLFACLHPVLCGQGGCHGDLARSTGGAHTWRHLILSSSARSPSEEDAMDFTPPARCDVLLLGTRCHLVVIQK